MPIPNIQTPPQYQPMPQGEQKKSNSRLLVLIIILIVVIAGGAVYYFLFYEKSRTNENANSSAVTNTQGTNTTNQSVAINNANTNQIVNVNSNTNQSANTNTNTNINQSSPLEAVDTDDDKVIDVVESWFGSSIDLKDSDSDGYDDFTEIGNGYNPNGPGSITQTQYISYCQGVLEVYEDNGIYNFSNTTKAELCSDWWVMARRVIEWKNGTRDFLDVDFDESLQDELCPGTMEQLEDEVQKTEICNTMRNVVFNIVEPSLISTLIID